MNPLRLLLVAGSLLLCLIGLYLVTRGGEAPQAQPAGSTAAPAPTTPAAPPRLADPAPVHAAATPSSAEAEPADESATAEAPRSPKDEIARVTAPIKASGAAASQPWHSDGYAAVRAVVDEAARAHVTVRVDGYACYRDGCVAELRLPTLENYESIHSALFEGALARWPGPRAHLPPDVSDGQVRAVIVLQPPVP